MTKASIALPSVRRPASSPWTDARIEHLSRRWSQGASAKRIARELGGLSRNAVLGKIHRLGIADLAPQTGRRQRACSKLRPAPARSAAHHPSVTQLVRERPLPAWIVDAEPYVDDPSIDAAIPREQRRSFLDLRESTCRWPVGDPSSSEFFFCGGECSANKAYCAEHCARASRPPNQQRSPRSRLHMLRSRSFAKHVHVGGESAAPGMAEVE